MQAHPAFRAPRRITITVPYGTYQRLLERSELEGRSLSNLAAFLLESAIGEQGAVPPRVI
jgi:CopG-like RHH_1 or ribbon-helix-helix domain, RHH_5